MKMERNYIAQTMCAAALALSASLLCAQPTGGGEHRKPPPEALDACKTLQSGQDCSFTSPQGAVKGSCFEPEGKPLACRPRNAPNGARSDGPPAPRK